MTRDISKTKIRTYSILVNNTELGYCDEPSVEIEQTLSEITLSQLHKQVMGHRIQGVKAVIKANVREINQANLGANFPWYSGSGNIALMPTALGADNYQYAKEVRLHPDDITGTGEDIILKKAVATGKINLKGDGDKDAVIPMEFTAYPDRTQLPNLVLGAIGE